MKNLLKISILVIVFAFILAPFINTFAINMNIDDYENHFNNTIDNDYEEEETSPTTTTTNNPTVTTNSSENDEFLTIENILSIVIIVIGIILIFLAIAILIRCK